MGEVMRIGVTANYTRSGPLPPRRRGLPYRGGDTIEIVEKLWPGVSKGGIFMCIISSVGWDGARIEATPSTLVLKRNPDRSRSTEKRDIADLRRINLYFDTADVYPVEIPTVEELARRIIALKRKFPQTNVLLAKRDIKSALRLIRLRPQLSRVMVTEFSGHHFGLEDDILMFYGVLPFGWGSSPGHFCRFIDAIARLHQLHGPSNPLWNMPCAFRSKMYIGDGLFVELEIGDRKDQSARSWEELARGVLSKEAVNEEKNRLEGAWCGQQIFLGFEIDTSSLEIRIPEEKRAGASVLFDELFASFGSKALRVLTLQRIRGNIEHFRSTDILWEYFTPPIDALLGCSDEAGIWAECGNAQWWLAFWESMKSIQLIRNDETQWARLFSGPLERLLPPEQRFACPHYPERVIWNPGDATLTTVDGVSWFGKEFFAMGAPDLTRTFKRNPSKEVIIGECELLATLLVVLIWGLRDGVERILIVRADNLNVFHWSQNWKAKSGTACRMLQALVDYMVTNRIEVIPRYVRSGHNFSGDHLSRTDEEGIQHWGTCNHMARVFLPDGWETFCEQWEPEIDFSPMSVIDIPSYIREHRKEVTCCEWRPSCFTFVACTRRLGINCFVHEPDHAIVYQQLGDCTEWNGQHVDLMCGMVWADLELSDFFHGVCHLRPSASVAITPSTFIDPKSCPRMWDDCILVDSDALGSVHNQKWRLYIWGELPPGYMQFTAMFRETRTLVDAYRNAGIEPMEDDIGVIRIIPFDFVSGLSVFVEGIGGVRYSLASHMPTLSMSAIRSGEPKWPKRRDNS